MQYRIYAINIFKTAHTLGRILKEADFYTKKTKGRSQTCAQTKNEGFGKMRGLVFSGESALRVLARVLPLPRKTASKFLSEGRVVTNHTRRAGINSRLVLPEI